MRISGGVRLGGLIARLGFTAPPWLRPDAPGGAVASACHAVSPLTPWGAPALPPPPHEEIPDVSEFTAYFGAVPDGAPPGWSSVLQSGMPLPLVGVLGVAGGEGRFTGAGVNDFSAATMNISDAATLADVTTAARLSAVGGGLTRGPGLSLLCRANALSAMGFSGYRIYTDYFAASGNLECSFQAFAANGSQWLNNSALLTVAPGLTTGTYIHLQASVVGPIAGRLRFRARAWIAGGAVPGWAVDQMVDVGMNGVTGPSGLAQRGGAGVRYASVRVSGNWPLRPAAFSRCPLPASSAFSAAGAPASQSMTTTPPPAAGEFEADSADGASSWAAMAEVPTSSWTAAGLPPSGFEPAPAEMPTMWTGVPADPAVTEWDNG